MSEASEQRPAPRFKVGQVVIMRSVKKELPFRVTEVILSEGEWFYGWDKRNLASEHMIRPLSIDEIGSDELSKLAEMLEGADSRRADMERERDEARAKLATSRDLCEKLIYAADILSHDCEKGANSGDWGNWGSGDWKELVDMRAVIAEAEAAQEAGK